MKGSTQRRMKTFIKKKLNTVLEAQEEGDAAQLSKKAWELTHKTRTDQADGSDHYAAEKAHDEAEKAHQKGETAIFVALRNHPHLSSQLEPLRLDHLSQMNRHAEMRRHHAQEVDGRRPWRNRSS